VRGRQQNSQLQKCETSLEAYASYTKTALKLADVRTTSLRSLNIHVDLCAISIDLRGGRRN